MKKWLSGFAALLLVTLALVSPASAQAGKFWLSAIGDNNEAVVNGRCLVLTAGANTLPTIYSDQALATTATNPLTMATTTGICEWFATASTTAFDVLMLVDSGAYKGTRVRVDNVTRTGQHTVRVNRASSLKVLAIPFPATAAATATTDSRTLPAGAIVERVTLWTTTAVVGSSIALGHGANLAEANLCNGAAPIVSGVALTENSTAAVGFSFCTPTATGTPRLMYVSAASGAVRIHNQSHATAGFAFIWYTEAGNEP